MYFTGGTISLGRNEYTMESGKRYVLCLEPNAATVNAPLGYLYQNTTVSPTTGDVHSIKNINLKTNLDGPAVYMWQRTA